MGRTNASAPRNLVICSDGTNNLFGSENTSIVRIVQAVVADPARQLIFYDPGVGTLPEPGLFSRTARKISGWLDLAVGTGLTRNVEEAYAYLMASWEPGDRVFLFGFSRGAYTVRVLAGMLHSLGLLPRGSQNLVPYVMRLFKSVRGGGRDNYWKLCNQFRKTFARDIPSARLRRFPVHFVGIWDTVSSVGWVWNPARFPYSAKNPSVSIVRHAVSVDERRWFFRQNLMQRSRGQDLQERWFPGCHSDVGGGYPEADGGLWRRPFEWVLDEAASAGLLLDPQRREHVLARSTASDRPWIDRQHESLQGAWWLAEYLAPKFQSQAGSPVRKPRLGLGRYRSLKPGALLDKSTLLRIRDSAYAPPNLSAAFLERVRRLPVVPDSLAYEP